MYNTIILLHGRGEITDKGDAIYGIDSAPKEIMRWSISDKAAARKELAKHLCSYREVTTFGGGTVVQADEWALEWCECDESGEYIDGADFELAAESQD